MKNLVFEGSGILGIAYLGVLDYLYENDLMNNIERTAGTSSGAITACLTSFHLPFNEIKRIVDSLDYRKAADRGGLEDTDIFSEEVKSVVEPVLGDISCLYRLITHYGWYSSEYFYQWIQNVIAYQFNDKKNPPFTFSDFRNPSLHKDQRTFHDLYIIGTDLTTGTSMVFSHETTPLMEVAQAVRISISIPLFFEAVQMMQPEITGNNRVNICCDGGVMNNYPIRLFDSVTFNSNLVRGSNMDTVGVRFMSHGQTVEINNLLDYIIRLILASGRVQQEAYYASPMDRVRSINIDQVELSPTDFNVSPNDEIYQSLYQQGYSAAKTYFEHI